MTTMFGITNCDTVRKARRWLDDRGIEYTFHDFRKDGLTEKLLWQWCNTLGYDTLLNRRGTTWRKLPEDVKNAMDATRAIEVMLENPAIIKRPVLDTDGTLHVGFSEDRYAQLFEDAG